MIGNVWHLFETTGWGEQVPHKHTTTIPNWLRLVLEREREQKANEYANDDDEREGQ